MRRITVILIALTVGLLISARAQASVFDPPNITLGVVNLLEDNDFEIALRAVDLGDLAMGFTVVSGSLAIDDFLLAVAEFPRYAVATNPTVDTGIFSSTTRMLTAVSLQQVLTVGPDVAGGNTATATGTTASVAEWLAITGLGVSAGTALQVYDDPIPAAGSGHLDNTSVALGIASASEGLFQYDIGFTGAAGEFLSTFTSTVAGSDPTDLSLITSLDSFGALNVILQAAGTPILANHNFLGVGGGSGLPLARQGLFSPADLQFQTNLATVAPGGFAISTDTDAYILPIPEPTAVTLWLMLSACAGFYACRRRARA